MNFLDFQNFLVGWCIEWLCTVYRESVSPWQARQANSFSSWWFESMVGTSQGRRCKSRWQAEQARDFLCRHRLPLHSTGRDRCLWILTHGQHPHFVARSQRGNYSFNLFDINFLVPNDTALWEVPNAHMSSQLHLVRTQYDLFWKKWQMKIYLKPLPALPKHGCLRPLSEPWILLKHREIKTVKTVHWPFK